MLDKIIFYKYSILLFTLIMANNLIGQNLPYACSCSPVVHKLMKQLPNNTKNTLDSVLLTTSMDSVLYANGFVLASTTVKNSAGQLLVVVQEGKQFFIDVLPNTEIPKDLKTQPTKMLPHQFYSYVVALQDYFANNGFPLAKVAVQQQVFQETTIEVELSIDKGEAVLIEEVWVEESNIIKPNYLHNLIGIHENDLFSSKKLLDMALVFSNEGNFSLEKQPTTSISAGAASIELDLKKIQNNKFEGFLGLLPSALENQKMLVVGNIQLELNNLFRSGKRLNLFWESYKPESQIFNFSYRHPFIFNAPLDVNLALDLVKEDSTFFNRSFYFDFSARLSTKNSLKLFSEQKSTALVKTSYIEEDNFANGKSSLFGLKFEHKNNSNASGTTIALGYGRRSVTSEKGMSETLYNAVKDGYNQGSLWVEQRYVKPLKTRFNWNIEFEGGHRWADYIFFNDVYRLGGASSIRGFNENEFFASSYAFVRNELRLYFESGSYVMGFTDFAYLEMDGINERVSDFPLGLGVGLLTDTKNGKFYVTFALGKAKNQTFSFDNSKIHFGYRAIF